MPVFATLVSLLALSSPTAAPQPAGESPAPGVAGMRASGPYLHISPGLFAWYVGAPVILYAWGVDAGYQFTRGRSFTLQVGGFMHHLPESESPVVFSLQKGPRSWWHNVRVGPELRIGGGDERVFGYLVVRAGVSFVVHDPAETWQPREVATTFTAGIGPGVQGALGQHRRFLLGFEPTLTFSGPVMYVEPRLLLGWRF